MAQGLLITPNYDAKGNFKLYFQMPEDGSKAQVLEGIVAEQLWEVLQSIRLKEKQ